MPHKDRETNNEYMRKYILQKYIKRMAQAHDLLGNKCVKCGSLENLEIDHIDPTTKNFSIGARAAGVSEVKFLEEVKKCQLLCYTCYMEKTLSERGQLPVEGRHGTITTYKKCRCEECRAAKAIYTKNHPYERRSRAKIN